MASVEESMQKMPSTAREWMSRLGRKRGASRGPTPFELSLKSELEVEQRRFANDWLFPWHNINVPDRVVEVDDFQGRRFSVNGCFEGQLQGQYWRAINRYVTIKIHDTVRSWYERTRSYTFAKRRSSLCGTEHLLLRFVAAIFRDASETDRRLRGKGSPASVPAYNASAEHSHANAEIHRLVEAHMAFFRGPTRKLEALAKENTWTFGIVAACIGVVAGLLIKAVMGASGY